MTSLPQEQWDWSEEAEELFQDWFTSNSGPWTFLCEYFYGDVQEPELKTREKLMHEWLKTAFKTGVSYGMPPDEKA